MITSRSQLSATACCLAVIAATGCASGPYRYGTGWHGGLTTNCASTSHDSPVEVQYGRQHKFLDAAGWVFGIPEKIMLWDRRVNNHQVSPETTAAVTEYLEQNNLEDVCVRINQYAPGAEWKRLRANHEVSAGWRYTVGLMHVAEYTLFPGRLFGGDHYNPYTNSVHVFSDVPSLALQSAAYSKDIHRRDYPGTYAAVNDLPVMSLWHESIATNDTLAYIGETGNDVDQREAKRILYPYYGMHVGGAVGMFVNIGPVFDIAGAAVGHVIGRFSPSSAPAVDPPTADPPTADFMSPKP